MPGSTPPPKSHDPFTDTQEQSTLSPRQSLSSNSSSSNASPSITPPGVGTPRSSPLKGQRSVHFGAGEGLDQHNNKFSFALRDANSPDPSPFATPPISSARPSLLRTTPSIVTTPPSESAARTSYFGDQTINSSSGGVLRSSGMTTPTLQVPTRSFRPRKRDEDEELNEKYDYFEDVVPQDRERLAAMHQQQSHSAPGSARTSPTLNPTMDAFSVGAGQVQGSVPVDNIPLLDIDGNNTSAAASPAPGGRPTSQSAGSTSNEKQQERERPKVIVTKEAHDLVRQHTQRRGPLGGKFSAESKIPQGLRSGYATPLPDRQHADYVEPPQQYRGGVLSSLLKLYNPPAGSSSSTLVGDGAQTPKYGPKHSHKASTSSLTSPPGSGRTTPKWYEKSAGQSTSSFGGLLAASGSALMAPGAATPVGGRPTQRPKLKHRSQSGGLASAIKHTMSRPNLEDEIRITVHIAETLARQKYIVKLCRALMLYGAPTHRLEEALKMSSRVLEIDGQFLYIPGCMIISFGDQSTHTSDMQIVRVPQGVDLGKLHDTHLVYKEVVHDIMGVEEATLKLEDIMKRKPKHNRWHLIPVYGIASASVGPFGFQARPIDMPILFFLGCLIGFLQLIVAPSSELYSNVFEISAAIMTSFLARAFGSINDGKIFCFSALAQGSIALILPGYIILCGSLELQSKNIVAGSVRMFYSIIYALFLGLGITIGSALYGLIDSNATSETQCHDTLDWKFNFLFVPPFTLCLLTINQARWRQAPIMIFIAFVGYIANYFSSQKFSSQPQIANGIGAFAVGILGNIYARVGHGLAFAAMLPAIFVQVPSGLAAQGSLIAGVNDANSILGNSTALASTGTSGIDSSVFEFGFSMIQVAIGITVGLFAAALVVYPLGKKRSGLFSF